MLAKAVKATPVSDNHAPGFSATGILPCSYGTYLNYWNLNPRDKKAASLLMEDGRDQEEAIIKQLVRAGFKLRYTGKDQLELLIGKAKVPGHPDGLIQASTELENMLEVKAMNSLRYRYFCEVGLEDKIKLQVQLYMSGLHGIGIAVPGTWVYAKSRETCEPEDRYEEYDPSFSKPLLQATDEIILGKWEPKPDLSTLCTRCRHSLYCWGRHIVSFIDSADRIKLGKVIYDYMKGKAYKAEGKELYERARDQMLLQLGDSNCIVVEGEILTEDGKTILTEVEVKKISSGTYKFSEAKFAELFGGDKLHLVMEYKPSEQVRTREL